MKKFLCALVMLSVLTACAFADSHRVGLVERLNTSPEEFRKMVEKSGNIVVMTNNPVMPEFSFYRSMNEMILALNAGEIDEILMPEAVADYTLDLHPEYTINCIVITRNSPYLLSFGFNADNKELAVSFDKAIREIKRDGTLINLQGKYVIAPNTAVLEESSIVNPDDTHAHVLFRKFEGAKEIKAAVTGDMPPIDYIAPDGSAQGFNVAILAEICGRLGLNVKLLSIESGSRAAMLSSGRADVVFWFEHRRGSSALHDVPKGIILSEPYYEFDTFYHLKPAK